MDNFAPMNTDSAGACAGSRKSRKTYAVFNAGHDEAMASGLAAFTPSLAARTISRDLALLPYWSFDCDGVVVPDAALCRDFLSRSVLPLPRRELVASLADAAGHCLEPWGWDRAISHRAARAGIEGCPAAPDIALLMRLQHRRFSSQFLARLLCRLRSCSELSALRFAGESHFAESVEEVEETVARMQKCVLKRPFSGSGRGIMVVEKTLQRREREWCDASCRRWGGVEVQRYCHCRADFAMEFTMTRGGCRFDGYSQFATSAGGAYAGNLLSAGSLRGGRVWNMLCADARCPQESAHAMHGAFCRCVSEELAAAAPEYSGVLGVDMMVCSEGGRLAVFPCVEINFRHTMGMVANSLGLVPEGGTTAWFRILYEQQRGAMLALTSQLEREHPPVKRPGSASGFAGGYLPLTPVTADTRFHACVMFC